MSLFPEIDEEIKEIKAKKKLVFENFIKNSKMYRPSNANDGDIFYANFCKSCSKENVEKEIFCEIWSGLFGGYNENIRELDDYYFCIKHDDFNIKDYL